MSFIWHFYYKFNYNFFKSLHDTTWLHETRQETKGLTSKNLSVNDEGRLTKT